MEDRLALIPQVPTTSNKLGSLTSLSPSLSPAMTPFLDDITQLPVTPPSSDTDPDTDIVLASAVHVLSTEATALSCLARLYQTDPSARNGFAKAVETITASAASGGKLIVCGVGKSGKIGEKLVATMNSLGVLSVFLHPVEALHGDIGILRPVRSIPRSRKRKYLFGGGRVLGDYVELMEP